MIGFHTAQYLRAEGYDVTLAARNPLDHDSPLAEFPALHADYTSPDLTKFRFPFFDAIVFSAGNDIRHIGTESDVDKFWKVHQSEGVPLFAAAAKAAGVKRFVQLGSYYHQAMPNLGRTNKYVEARRLADDRSRALADSDFNISTLNPPSIVGVIPQKPAARFVKFVAWGRGELPEVPDFGPVGGTNYMSIRSLTQAIRGALENAESGRAYLIGDQNLTFTEHFQMWIDATGGRVILPERDQEHLLLPDAAIVPDRESVLSYGVDPEDLRVLRFEQNDVRRAIEEIVELIP